METTKTIYIKGMFCTNCETRVRKALLSLPGVKKANVSFERQTAQILFDPALVADEDLRKCVADAGYEIVSSGRTGIQTAAVLLILLAVWMIARHFGWTQIFNLAPDIETSLGIGALFVTGLLTSVHCIAMCGGINLTQSVMAAGDKKRLFRSNALYQAGRVLSYTLTGAAVGGIGQVFSVSSTVRGIIMIAAGAVIFLMALSMLGLFRPLRKFSFRFTARLYSGLNARLKTDSSFVIGLLNGLMPCGPLQSMQIYALSTGSAVMGALSMFAFSLGTVPLLLGFGLLSGNLNRKYKRVMLTVSAVVIFIMGVNMVMNGISLIGNPNAVTVGTAAAAAAVQKGDVQILRTEIDYGKYPAIQVRAGIPVQWTIVVPEGKLTGCNREIIVPALGLDVHLHEGENLVSFTADEAGLIPYSCWMGMIRSTIEVSD